MHSSDVICVWMWVTGLAAAGAGFVVLGLVNTAENQLFTAVALGAGLLTASGVLVLSTLALLAIGRSSC